MPLGASTPKLMRSPDRVTPGAASAWRGGITEAIGAPALVLGASYLGFGSFVHQSGIGVDFALASTFSAWALPGQVALLQVAKPLQLKMNSQSSLKTLAHRRSPSSRKFAHLIQALA